MHRMKCMSESVVGFRFDKTISTEDLADANQSCLLVRAMHKLRQCFTCTMDQ
ncbi:hypothetical protein BABINDRAFT_163392 [Babjeviella inositovora NRRL Y-12698]|uniref:Uncharacterized protein n=1 Tax=Babjeviella inositovora NRRL Y-12698 TaxID=984486 RepID=A0A1E3QJ08_9ASCO|nr:uncharacterized protein BABINDRAFT_163392 [Babjeviella inositovora NRRL Y-12698]ODQ77681.1 hypothetical protein BABINDRAFT_163392 [Babjeviella inositovora NRRL Y-12698]